MEFESIAFKPNPYPLPIIAGPCSVEGEKQVHDVAQALAKLGIRDFRAGVWKPRTKPGSFEGLGEICLPWLEEIQKEWDLNVWTEIANPQHIEACLKNKITHLWIGARTTSSPFVMQEIAEALKGVDASILIKNPVNPDLELWIGAIERIYNSGIRKIGAIHRGFSIYGTSRYRNPPAWQIPIELKRKLPNLQIISDPSHITGRRDLISEILQRALNLNYNGFIIETHQDPTHARSDADQQLTPAMLHSLLSQLSYPTLSENLPEDLEIWRAEIDDIDEHLLGLLAKRMKISKEIGSFKAEKKIPILQTNRYQHLQENRKNMAISLGISEDFAENLFSIIHEESIEIQSSQKNNQK